MVILAQLRVVGSLPIEKQVRGSIQLFEVPVISRGEEPDAKAEERGDSTSREQPIAELLAARNLQHLAPVLDKVGVGKAADLSCIFLEDRMEEGVGDSDALRLLHGFETCGAVRSFHPSSPEQRALPLKLCSRFGAVGPHAPSLCRMTTGGMILPNLPPYRVAPAKTFSWGV